MKDLLVALLITIVVAGGAAGQQAMNYLQIGDFTINAGTTKRTVNSDDILTVPDADKRYMRTGAQVPATRVSVIISWPSTDAAKKTVWETQVSQGWSCVPSGTKLYCMK